MTSGPTRTAIELAHELDEAERKAWDSLGRYKFWMFGYWAAIWVHLNRIGHFKRSNPWKVLVLAARAHQPLVVHPIPAPLLGDRPSTATEAQERAA